MWLYDDKEFDIEDRGDAIGFVYEVRDKTNDMRYIGKKLLFSTRRLQPLKGQKRKRKVVKESDWQDYFGSSEEVKQLVESHGRQRFKREILKLCKSKGECSYYEAKLQFDFDVLFRDDYYNEFIGIKIHSKHLK